MSASCRPSHLLTLVALLSVLLVGCESGDKPSSSFEIAKRGLYSAALSPSGQFAFAGSIHHGGSLWTVADRERRYNWNHVAEGFSGIVAAHFSSNEQYLVSADERTIALWETGGGRNLSFWSAPGDIEDLDITPNGDYAILALGDHTAVLFDIKRGGVQRTFLHEGPVRAVALASRARMIITGSDDNRARVFKVSSGKLMYSFMHENQVNVVAISEDGKFGFSASQADQAVIWDLQNGQEISRLPLDQYPYTAGATYTAARFSEDGSRLLTGASGRLVQVWDCASGRELRRLRGNKKERWKPTNPSIVAVGFENQEQSILAIGSDGMVYRF